MRAVKRLATINAEEIQPVYRSVWDLVQTHVVAQDAAAIIPVFPPAARRLVVAIRTA